MRKLGSAVNEHSLFFEAKSSTSTSVQVAVAATVRVAKIVVVVAVVVCVVVMRFVRDPPMCRGRVQLFRVLFLIASPVSPVNKP